MGQAVEAWLGLTLLSAAISSWSRSDNSNGLLATERTLLLYPNADALLTQNLNIALPRSRKMPKILAMASSYDDLVTRLLTVLNTVSSKRPFVDLEITSNEERPAKLNKKAAVVAVGEYTIPSPVATVAPTPAAVAEEETQSEESHGDPYDGHFGDEPSRLALTRQAAQDVKWQTSPSQCGKLGHVVNYKFSATMDVQPLGKSTIVKKLREPLEKLGSNCIASHRALQSDMWTTLSSYQDLFVTNMHLNTHSALRDVTTLHLLNHVNKKRRRILKNNDRIAHAPKETPPESVRDQGFTRASVLILLPFRSFAVKWLESFRQHLSDTQVENHSRFNAEYPLPPDVVDKLLSAEPGAYPADHVEMMQGNTDDDFKLGIKLTRKSFKLYSEFYSSDIIIASPFGLRRVIDKDGDSDFLSSIEILVMDQVDALSMQNWDHLLHGLSHLNQLPKGSHDTDFSRVKPWYLDGYAKYLRQTLIFSPYETPDMRSLFNSCDNVEGKLRTRGRWLPVAVPEGIRQVFTPFDSSHPQDEMDRRFEAFTTQMFPSIMRSAVESSNTIIFVPSYFDFVRLRHWMKQRGDVSYTVLFEDSSNADISRARHAFFSGQKSFLLTTERFHFFRRYLIRGARNIVFYAPPDHCQFYSEYLSFPFLDEGVEASEVNCKVLYSKWDFMRLERIVGSEKIKDLVKP